MREGWRQSARPAAQRAAAALRALETDTIEGRSQRAYESSDPKKEELRGRSMRVRTPTWRALGEPERDPSPKAPYRMSEKSLRASSLRASSAQPKFVRRPATAKAAIERIRQERGEGAEDAELEAARKAAEQKAAQEAKRKAAELKAAKEVEALQAARTLLASDEAPTVKQARSIEQKKALASALAEVDAALEKSALLQTPRPSASALMLQL